MTPQQEAALKLLYERAGEHRRSAHVDTTGLNRHIVVNLILAGSLTINADNTVTFTVSGIAAVIRLRRMSAERKRQFRTVRGKAVQHGFEHETVPIALNTWG